MLKISDLTVAYSVAPVLNGINLEVPGLARSSAFSEPTEREVHHLGHFRAAEEEVGHYEFDGHL